MSKILIKIKIRRGIRVLIVLALIAALTGGLYYFLLTHTVRNVSVEGNLHYTAEEIKDMVITGPLSENSLYLSLVYKDKQITDIPFIASLSVEVVTADTVKIKVLEKSFAGYVKYLGRNVYFDMDGTVVEISDVITGGVPEITGLAFDHVILNEPLPVEDPEIFYLILTVTKALDKYHLTADRIYFDAQRNFMLYFGSVRVNFGSAELLDEKISLLEKELLPKLEGESGTLNLQNYDENTKSFSFQKDVEN